MGATASTRERLPNRRMSATFDFVCAGLRYTATIGRFPDGRVAPSYAVALQCGADIETIRKALCRDSHGQASGPLGVALDLLADDGGGAP
jgi:hypothetical protein